MLDESIQHRTGVPTRCCQAWMPIEKVRNFGNCYRNQSRMENLLLCPLRVSARACLGKPTKEGKGVLMWSAAKETPCHFQTIGCPPTLTCFAQLASTRL